MDERELQSLRDELQSGDQKEQQERKSVRSRRWFMRTLAGAAAGAVLGTAMDADAACSPPGGTNTCSAANTCGVNTCAPNTCGTNNTCTTNSCTTGNVCTAVNNCTTANNQTCATGNTCTTNTCTANNNCTFNTCTTNTCATDICSGVNTCTTLDNCTTDDQCWPLLNTCSGTNTDCGYFDV